MSLPTDTVQPDAIAVVGLSLQVAGGINDAQSFWKFLLERRSAMTKFPGSRFNVDGYSGHGGQNTLPQRGGHFIGEDISRFDGPFFGMSPVELVSMDPQQRLALETSYHALENAGISLDSARGTSTAVFIGATSHDYEIQGARDPDVIEKYSATGLSMAMLANRISWYYDFRGPSMTVDTACSSSLNALHLACQSLRSGECDMGLVGGVNLFWNIDPSAGLNSLGMLSPQSISNSFNDQADGFSRGEGCSFVVLKPLSKALNDGDTIRAVIRATHVNQDGRTASIVQPSTTAQHDLIKGAYSSLDMTPMRYFEAHGTGTLLGDELEAKAIHSAFCPKEPIFVGAVKSNFGHLEGGSGVLSVVKTVLVLEHGIIPPNFGTGDPSPSLSFDGLLQFPQTATVWPNLGLRRASINSFGFGGANVHVVLDDALHYLRQRDLNGRHNTKETPTLLDCSTSRNRDAHDVDSKRICPPKLLVLTSADEEGTKRLAHKYINFLEENPSLCEILDIDELARVLSTKRTLLPWRSFTVTDEHPNLVANFRAISQAALAAHKPSVAFIFTGQGANWACMGTQLNAYEVYRNSLTQAEAYYRMLGASWSLKEEIEKPGPVSRLEDAEYSQPVCTAIQIAMVDLLVHWGVEPTVVVGHSSGEIAAAYCSGAISKKSAWRIAYYRGLLVADLIKTSAVQNTMMAVGLSSFEVEKYLERLAPSHGITVACFNSPSNVTLAGLKEHLLALKAELVKDGVFAKLLKIDVAYHSVAMQSISKIYGNCIGEIETGDSSRSASVMVSTVSGETIPVDATNNPAYWVANLVSPVRFMQAISLLRLRSKENRKNGIIALQSSSSLDIDMLLEIGPHTTLKGPLREVLEQSYPGSQNHYTSMLRRGISADETVLHAAGELFSNGVDIDLSKVNITSTKTGQDYRDSCADLPPYPFDHSRSYWSEGRFSRNSRLRRFAPHELLGHQSLDWNASVARWQNFISLSTHPWVEHHKVAGSYIYPGAGILAMAIEASRQVSRKTPTEAFRFRDVFFERALVIPSHGSLETQLVLELQPDQNDPTITWYKFSLYLFEDQDFRRLSQGYLGCEHCEPIESSTWTGFDRTVGNTKYDSQASGQLWKPIPSDSFYTFCDDLGLEYGKSFRALQDISVDSRQGARAKLSITEWQKHLDGGPYQDHVIHPAALDAMFHLGIAALSQLDTATLMIPTKVHDLWISSKGLMSAEDSNQGTKTPSVDVSTSARYTGYRHSVNDIGVWDVTTGETLIRGSLMCTSVNGNGSSGNATGMYGKNLCYGIDWQPDLDLLSAEEITSLCAVQSAPKIAYCEDTERKMRLVCYLSSQLALKSAPSSSNSDVNKYINFLRRFSASGLAVMGSNVFADAQQKVGDLEYLEELCAEIERAHVGGKLVARVARNLSPLLHGKVTALELLFSDSLMDEYYRHLLQSLTIMSQMKSWFNLFAHKRPQCRILEIGAGTGSATRELFDVLTGPGDPRFTEYTFTDISPRFFEPARVEFAEYSDRMHFSLLDIEKCPVEQGFEANSYDVVTACNAIHVTKDLRDSLRNARRLLTTGGKLVLLEGVNPEDILPGFHFGLVPGWFVAQDSFRIYGPLTSESHWHQALIDTGFSGIDVSFRNYIKDMHGGSVMIATAIEPIECSPQPSSDDHIQILISSSSEAQLSVANQLKMHLDAPSSIWKIDAKIDLEDCQTRIYLSSLDEDVLCGKSSEYFNWLKHILHTSKTLLWAFDLNFEGLFGPTYGMIPGLLRVAAAEYPESKFVSLGLDFVSAQPQDAASKIATVFKTTATSEAMAHQLYFMEQNGRLCIDRAQTRNSVNRYVSDRTQQSLPELQSIIDRPLYLTVGSPGLLETLQFVEDSTICAAPLNADDIVIEVMACGLNFVDILVALGEVPGETLGLECAGIVRQAGSSSNFNIGDRVCCTALRSLASYTRCASTAAIKMPTQMSFTQGASWMVSYTTAYYALFTCAHLQEGESVLIHSGAGALGQACIQLARLRKATIYVTVGSPAKRDVLVRKYNIPESHIFGSRDGQFASQILTDTKGYGVDVVVNSLSGQLLKASWQCVSAFGRFIEVGKRDMQKSSHLPMAAFEKNVTFFGVDIKAFALTKREVLQPIWTDVLRLADEGKLTIEEPTSFPLAGVEEAFRHLQSGESSGKVVLQVEKEDKVKVMPSTHLQWSFDTNATYVVVGAFGGLGREIVMWMARRGAKYLILLGRNGPARPVAKRLLEDLQRFGVQVIATACDISNDTELSAVLQQASGFPPIRGCIQAAMILDDRVLHTMPYDSFNMVSAPKVRGSWNLHKLLPSGLDFFIMLASASGIMGVHGQAGYGSGSAYQDELAFYRLMKGERALSVDLGRVLSAGYAAENFTGVDALRIDRTFGPGIALKEMFAVLEYYCRTKPPTMRNIPIREDAQVAVGLATPAQFHAMGISDEPRWMRQPVFQQLPKASDGAKVERNNTNLITDIASTLKEATSLEDAARCVLTGLTAKLERTLGINPKDLNTQQPLSMYGVDSLNAVEIRTWLRQNVGADMLTFDILSSEHSIAGIAYLAASKSVHVPDAIKQ